MNEAIKRPCILVVEDEPLVRMDLEEALIAGGFDVELAANGEEGVEVLAAKKGVYRGLVTDIRLSGTLLGWDVARRARELDPTLPVVYITGDSEGDWPAYGVPNSLILAKPFAQAQLVTAIAQMINLGAQGPS